MHNTTINNPSVLANLRSLLPPRPLRLPRALLVAERQADRLLRLRDVTEAPVPSSIVLDGPRLTVQADPRLARAAVSGCSYWDADHRRWVIALNPDEPHTRQRFTVLHEYAHIVRHQHPGLAGRLPRRIYGLEPEEYIADYFAGCTLMPKRLMQAAFYAGIQTPEELAELFDVSARAVEVRLAQLGLAPEATSQPRRPAPPRGTRRSRYFRHSNYAQSTLVEVVT